MASTPRKTAPGSKPGARKKAGTTRRVGAATAKALTPRRTSAQTVGTPSTRGLLAQRETQLELIDLVQSGVARKLSFQAIVDIVGDRLREIIDTPDLIITWFDEERNLIRSLYTYEHGRRIEVAPSAPKPGGLYETMRATHGPIVLATAADYARVGNATAPGTDLSRSLVCVPIFVGDRMAGDISIENYERENAFGPDDVQILTTVAASLGGALDNAHLFDETQRLLKETEQRNAELAVINSIQRGVAAELDFQKIIDLVGDKLREVLKTDEIGIRWLDYDKRVAHYLYE